MTEKILITSEEAEREFITGEDRVFEEGDIVTVVENGHAYPFYAQFFEDNKISRIIAARYAYGEVPEDGIKGVVYGIYPHLDTELALIQVGKYIYLIDVEGLEKV